MKIPSDRFHVSCGACQHVWIAAYLPMDMRKMATLMKGICCPRCAERKKVFVASKEQASTLYPENPA